MNATELLLRQQHRLSQLVADLRRIASPAPTRVRELAEEVKRHVSIEDSLVASLERRQWAAWNPPHADAGVMLIVAVQRLGAVEARDEWTQGLAALEVALQNENAFEQEELIPELETRFSDTELGLLGRSLEACYVSAVAPVAA